MVRGSPSTSASPWPAACMEPGQGQRHLLSSSGKLGGPRGLRVAGAAKQRGCWRVRQGRKLQGARGAEAAALLLPLTAPGAESRGLYPDPALGPWPLVWGCFCHLHKHTGPPSDSWRSCWGGPWTAACPGAHSPTSAAQRGQWRPGLPGPRQLLSLHWALLLPCHTGTQCTPLQRPTRLVSLQIPKFGSSPQGL